jgi:hypothetical protein
MIYTMRIAARERNAMVRAVDRQTEGGYRRRNPSFNTTYGNLAYVSLVFSRELVASRYP